MKKSWINRTSFGEHVKDFSYEEFLDAFGKDRGAEVAKHFGIKPQKKTTRKKKEDKGEE